MQQQRAHTLAAASESDGGKVENRQFTRFGIETVDRIKPNPDPQRNEGTERAMHTRTKCDPFFRSFGTRSKWLEGQQHHDEYAFHEKTRIAIPAIAIAPPPI